MISAYVYKRICIYFVAAFRIRLISNKMMWLYEYIDVFKSVGRLSTIVCVFTQKERNSCKVKEITSWDTAGNQTYQLC